MTEVAEISRQDGATVETHNYVDEKLIAKLEHQLEVDGVKEHWGEIAAFLAPYRSSVTPNEIKINYKPGEMGKGTLDGNNPDQLTVEIPDEQEAINLLQTGLQSAVKLTTEEARSLLYTLEAQTVLHEGTHALLDSKPGSTFAQAIELKGVANKMGYDSTLLDEGITYAIQNYFAPISEKLGRLTVRPHTVEEMRAETDLQKRETLKRKILGNRLTPLVEQYLNSQRQIDEDFIDKAVNMLKEIKETA